MVSLNSDVMAGGLKYHIQTEDWGPSTGCIVTQIFLGGSIKRTVKTMYNEINPTLVAQSANDLVIKAMQDQHDRVLDLLVSGQIL
jgi:hypothetical protein